MRAATTAELRLDGRLVARGLAEIRTWPSSWDASLFATAGYDISRLRPGVTYELCAGNRHRFSVQLVSIKRATQEVRMLGVEPLPDSVQF